MHRLDTPESINPLPFTPAQEHGGGARVSNPRIPVANVDGEECLCWHSRRPRSLVTPMYSRRVRLVVI